MQRWAFGLECPSFKTIDKINKVKYVSSLFWLCSRSRSVPSSNLLQLSSVTAALPPCVYILNRSVFPTANWKLHRHKLYAVISTAEAGVEKQARARHKRQRTNLKSFCCRPERCAVTHQQWKVMLSCKTETNGYASVTGAEKLLPIDLLCVWPVKSAFLLSSWPDAGRQGATV